MNRDPVYGKTYDEIMSVPELKYEEDIREDPDSLRQGRFKAGWRDATERGQIYTDLTKLTWQNFGNRLGKHFGEASDEQIDTIFQWLAEHYQSHA